MEILIFIWHCFWLMTPAYLANSAPVLMKWLPFLNYPVDFGKSIGRKGNKSRIFGSNKTWRGIFFAIVFGIIAFQLQRLIGWQSFIDYKAIGFAEGLLWGFLLGFGAIAGDLAKSFFKRRINIKPGKSWIPFDQIDLAVGAILLTLPVFSYTWLQILVILALTFILTIGANFIGYSLKWRDTKI